MKKLLSVLLFMMLLVLSGCSQESTEISPFEVYDCRVNSSEPVCTSRNFYLNYVNLIDENHIIDQMTIEEIYQAIENEDTFILFAGRPSCPHCQTLMPRVNHVAKELGIDKVGYLNFDSEDNLKMDFVEKYDIQYVPVLFAFKDGELVESLSGGTEDLDKIVNVINID